MKDKISILGQEYKLLRGSSTDYPNLTDANGYTDLYAKMIVIDEQFGTKESGFKSDNPAGALNKLYRHEIVHAFISESAIGYNLSSAEEELYTDWLAEQFPKMKKIFEELGVDE